MTVLPLDVIWKLIGFLAADDPKHSSTKACSLVCRDFHAICKKRIFAVIVLAPSIDEAYLVPTSSDFECGNTSALQALLSRTPDIGECIQDLHYTLASNDLKCPDIISTFKKITNLRRLMIAFPIDLPALWNNNPLRPAFIYHLHLPTLQSFAGFNLNAFVVADLIACVNLQSLILMHAIKPVTVRSPSNYLAKSPMKKLQDISTLLGLNTFSA
ncbi:hypothetical protein BDN70DRAFT_966574 [Pholiota conissans]|uniref:F-box domain-containing protein n=1 Tax=Pholiota conissans TaxID=109636 RepID=A0A9P6CV18_9AGAR|nr:hypothetical protein BDN70DRAFT_966574 [Pholiota conissans]